MYIFYIDCAVLYLYGHIIISMLYFSYIDIYYNNTYAI